MKRNLLPVILAIVLPWTALGNDSQTMTPNQLLTQEKERLFDNVTEFTIHFYVSVVTERPTTFPDGSSHQVLHLIPSDSTPLDCGFSVPLTRETEATLKRIGITDIKKHFTGKIITVKGLASQTGLMLIGSPTRWTHHIGLRSLDQIVSLEEPARRTD